MNDKEWKDWAHKLDRILGSLSLKDDLEELEGLADAIKDGSVDDLERNDGSGWTWHMGGDWGDAIGKLETHLQQFDPKAFDAYLASIKEAGVKP